MSFVEWLNMGGYAGYVWTSFGLTLVILVMNVVLARSRHRKQRLLARRRQANAEESR